MYLIHKNKINVQYKRHLNKFFEIYIHFIFQRAETEYTGQK